MTNRTQDFHCPRCRAYLFSAYTYTMSTEKLRQLKQQAAAECGCGTTRQTDEEPSGDAMNSPRVPAGAAGGCMSAEMHTPGLLPPLPLKVFRASDVTAILDANGDEVVGWMGFDDSNRTRAEHDALAERIVLCCNTHDELVAAVRDALEFIEEYDDGWGPDPKERLSRTFRAALSKAGSPAHEEDDGIEHDPLCIKLIRSYRKKCTCGADERAKAGSPA